MAKVVLGDVEIHPLVQLHRAMPPLRYFDELADQETTRDGWYWRPPRPTPGAGFTVWGSVTLNPPVGGVDPTVVDLAAAHGAKVVFLPTWSSAADRERGGYIQNLLRTLSPGFDRYHERTRIELLDGGALAGATREVIDACRERDLSLATGHASLAESPAIAEYCAEHGQRLMITHPLHYVERPEQLREFAELGALVEFPGAPLVHPEAHLSVRQTYEAIRSVGPSNVVLTTDVFSKWCRRSRRCCGCTRSSCSSSAAPRPSCARCWSRTRAASSGCRVLDRPDRGAADCRQIV